MSIVRGFGLLLSAGALVAGGCSSRSHLSQDGPHGPQCAAIQSAEDIGFSSDRAAALRRIAVDPSLTEHEQQFVVDATLNRGFSADQADILTALASNPAMTQGSREYLAERLRRSSMFSRDRLRVTEALVATKPAPG